jgi:hypothetical protein
MHDMHDGSGANTTNNLKFGRKIIPEGKYFVNKYQKIDDEAYQTDFYEWFKKDIEQLKKDITTNKKEVIVNKGTEYAKDFCRFNQYLSPRKAADMDLVNLYDQYEISVSGLPKMCGFENK